MHGTRDGQIAGDSGSFFFQCLPSIVASACQQCLPVKLPVLASNVWQTLSIGKSPRVPNNLIILGLCMVVCHTIVQESLPTLPVLRCSCWAAALRRVTQHNRIYRAGPVARLCCNLQHSTTAFYAGAYDGDTPSGSATADTRSRTIAGGSGAADSSTTAAFATDGSAAVSSAASVAGAGPPLTDYSFNSPAVESDSYGQVDDPGEAPNYTDYRYGPAEVYSEAGAEVILADGGAGEVDAAAAAARGADGATDATAAVTGAGDATITGGADASASEAPDVDA